MRNRSEKKKSGSSEYVINIEFSSVLHVPYVKQRYATPIQTWKGHEAPKRFRLQDFKTISV
jgi:hypothetical protein